MSEQLYIKKGRKYVKVNDPYVLDGLEQGAWLVVVDGSCTSISKKIDLKLIELEASLKYLEEGMTKAMLEESRLQPASRLISKKEKKAWEAYKKIMGDDIPTLFKYSSLCDIAKKGCEYIKEKAELV